MPASDDTTVSVRYPLETILTADPRSSRLLTPSKVNPNTTRSEALARIRSRLPSTDHRAPCKLHEARAPRLVPPRYRPSPSSNSARAHLSTRVDTRAVATTTPGLLAGGCGPGPVPAARRDAVGKGEGRRGARAKGEGAFGIPRTPFPLRWSLKFANSLPLLAAGPILQGAS